MTFKPMLSGKIPDINKFPFNKTRWLVTPKLDGIRALTVDGDLVSRSLKKIQNHHIRESVNQLIAGTDIMLDGELMLQSSTATLQDVVSAVMSRDGTPAFRYVVFDFLCPSQGVLTTTPYLERMEHLIRYKTKLIRENRGHFIDILTPQEVVSKEAFMGSYQDFLDRGMEGLMVRSFDSPYKHGRSTYNEGWLLKYKPEEDSEAVVIGFEQRYHNQNEAITNALGHTERSSKAEGLVPVEQVGRLNVKDIKSGLEFGVGTGFTDEERTKMWLNQSEYLGKILTYRFSPVGVDLKTGMPRFPSFKGFRHPDDMGGE